MFDIINLNIYLNKNGRKIVENLSFSAGKNDKIAIIGEEGNGKSTIIKAIAGDASIYDYATVTGKWNNKKLVVGYLPQSLSSEVLNLTVIEYFAHSEINDFDYSFFEYLGEIKKLIKQFGLNENLLDSDRKLSSFSGGEKLKIELIKLLIQDPDILLLDEPTNDLDIHALVWLEKFINNSIKPIIFVSHDEELLNNTANKILLLESLKKKTECKWTLKSINYSEFIKVRRAEILRQDQIARFERDKFDAKMERWQRIYNRVDNELNTISRQDPHGGRLLAKKMKSVTAQKAKFEKERENLPEFSNVEEAIFLDFGNNALDKNRIICDLLHETLKVGENILSNDINLLVKAQDKVTIIGKNGCGKTTLLKKIIDEINLKKDVKLGIMPQNYEDEFKGFNTVESYIFETAFDKIERTRLKTFLGSLNLTPAETQGEISELSGGTKVKLILAKLMSKGVNVLVLDEPTRNLSPLSCPVLRVALNLFSGAIISVSHDRAFIKNCSDKVYELSINGLSDVTQKFKI